MTSPRASPLPPGHPSYLSRSSTQASRAGNEATHQDRPSTASSLLPGGPPIFSKRARQIQEEDGISLPAAPHLAASASGSTSGTHKPSPFREGEPSFGLLRPPNHGTQQDSSDQPNKGRARAGTLPSSWAGQGQPSRGSTGHHTGSRYADRLHAESQMARSGASSPIAHSDVADHADDFDHRRSALRSNSSIGHTSNALPSQRPGPGPSHLSSGFNSPNPYSDVQHAVAGLAPRFRSGSLASGLQSDPFGSAFFATWADSSPSQRHSQSAAPSRDTNPVRGRGATIANPSTSGGTGWGGAGATGATANFESIDQDVRTLDYLGLDDSQGFGNDFESLTNRPMPLAGRDRATTLASATSRPHLNSDLRDFAATYTPSDRWNYIHDTQQNTPTTSDALANLPSAAYLNHGGLAQSSLQQRLGDDLHRNLSTPALRARAISVGMLDAPNAGNEHQSGRNLRHLEGATASLYSGNRSPLTSDSISPEALYEYAIERGLDPESFGRALACAGITVTSSRRLPLEETNRQSINRLRAGTIAALGGPGSRTRTEQELSRLATSTSGGNLPPRSHASSYPIIDESIQSAIAHAPSTGSVGPAQGSVGASRGGNSGSAMAGQQATRSLWVGNLGPSTTGQELMQAFASYGAIESLRLLPEKECGFVNFVDIEDAVRARDDVTNRLCGRIRATGTGPNGTVRIGFGKIDTPTDSLHVHPAGSSTAPGASGAKARSVSPLAGASANPGADRDENFPTRALWIGSIPNTTTPAALLSLFQPYGPIESARVLTHKNCGFINFERVDDAVRARKMLNGRDLLGSEVGAVRIGFAKIPNRGMEDAFAKDPSGESLSDIMPALEHLKGAAAISADHQALSGGLENYRSNLVTDLLQKQQQQRQRNPQPQGTSATSMDSQLSRRAGSSQVGLQHPAVSALSLSHTRSASNSGLSASSSIVPSSEKGGVPLPSEMQPRATSTDVQLIMEQLSRGEDAQQSEAALTAVQQFRPPATYYTSIPLVSEPTTNRRFDTNKLRDLRKAIEQNQYSPNDIDDIAKGYLDSIVDLASDYIGNTVVQKFFEKCSEPTKTAMLERLAPHLATIGIHKNGTWAAQKIIDTAQMPEQRALISLNIRPYLPPLLLDQFGNYVVQCLLPYGAHREVEPIESDSDFIFDSIVDRCWEIAQGRFGARSVRACLESQHASRMQRKRVAISIILNAVPLTTSPNGALLLTWLLDASNLPGRYGLLAPRFTPHLTHLCTHKLASQTVLRVINQNLEPEASDKILDALFNSHNDEVLEEVLTDQVHGSQFLTKLLSSPQLQASRHEKHTEQIKRMVVEHNLVSVPAYRKLIEDLGLPFMTGPHTSSNGPLMRMAQASGQPDARNSGGQAQAEGIGAMFRGMSLGGSGNVPPMPMQTGSGPAHLQASQFTNTLGPTQLAASNLNRFEGSRSPFAASLAPHGAAGPGYQRAGQTRAGPGVHSWEGSGNLGPPPHGAMEGHPSLFTGGHSPVLHHHGQEIERDSQHANLAYSGHREMNAGFPLPHAHYDGMGNPSFGGEGSHPYRPPGHHSQQHFGGPERMSPGLAEAAGHPGGYSGRFNI